VGWGRGLLCRLLTPSWEGEGEEEEEEEEKAVLCRRRYCCIQIGAIVMPIMPRCY
jgi:hypothetical protein